MKDQINASPIKAKADAARPKGIDLSPLKDKWPSTIVCRDQVKEFTGGLITSGTMANLDSRGEGPPLFYMGNKKVGYLVDRFIPWLERRVSSVRPNAVPKGTRKRPL